MNSNRLIYFGERFNYTTTYRKAWLAKQKAVEQLYGNWESSNNELPRWLQALQTFMPGTIIQMETIPAIHEGNIIPGYRIFHRLFWAFEPCIRGFAYCKPNVQVDGTFLYGKYRGTLLLAVAQDGNNNIFPIAFALVEGEIGEAWSFFLKNLRKHVTPQSNICLISDRHQSIKSSYLQPQNGWLQPPSVHVYCVRHIAQNFMREFKNTELRKLVVNMGYALNKPSFDYYRKEIYLRDREAVRWLDSIAKEKWTQAYDEGRRWGHMTTNLAESINSVLKGTRNLPITSLVQATYFRLAELFARRGRQIEAMIRSGQEYSENLTKDIEKQLQKANTHQIHQFD